MVTALKRAITGQPAPIDLPGRWLALVKEVELAPTTAEQRRIRERRTDQAIDAGDELLLCEIGAVDPNLPPEFRAAVTARLHDVRLPLVAIDGAIEAQLYRCLSHTALSFDVPVPANNRLEPVMWRHEVPVAVIAQRILDRRPRDERTRAELTTAADVKTGLDASAMAAGERARAHMRRSSDWDNLVNDALSAHATFESAHFRKQAIETFGARTPEELHTALLGLAAAEANHQ